MSAPGAFTVHKAATITDAFKKVVAFTADWAVNDPPLLWFRGVKDASLDLRPGAVWRKDTIDYKEHSTLVEFTQEAAPFEKVARVDDWATYYLAQHHRVPTRLLDWTESFSAALFFALDGWQEDADEPTCPCIWVLQPVLLNKAFSDYEGIISPENNEELEEWLPSQVRTHFVKKTSDGSTYDNEWPLAIYPRRSNRRLAAQMGSFTVHGRRAQALDVLLAERQADVAACLTRIDLDGSDAQSARKELQLLGIRRSAIFPDIDSLVQQMSLRDRW